MFFNKDMQAACKFFIAPKRDC